MVKIIIGHCGDLHGNHEALKLLKTKEKCNFIINTGDFTDTEKDDDGYVQATKDLGLVYGQDFANSQGNHESQEESGEGAQQAMETAFPVLKQTKWLQNYQIGNVVLIVGNTQIPGYSQPDNEHMTFIKASLTRVKELRDSGQIDWVFYAQHKPFYTMKARHDSDYNFRYNVHPLFDEYGVDISLHGHNHDMQRTKPIMYGGPANAPPKINNKMLADAHHDMTTIPHGVIVAINGSATKNTAFSGKQDAWTVYANASGNAYSVYTIEGEKLTGQYIEIGTGKILHEFKASKKESIIAGPPPTQEPPTPPPGEPAPGPGYRWHPELKKWVPILEHPSFLPADDTEPDPTSPTPPPTPIPPPSDNPKGELDQMGIKWLVAKGAQTMIKQTRDEADDDRWSGNVKGLKQGFEATMIAKSTGVASDGHFAMKHGGGNHSGGNAAKQRWYDTGLRSDGSVQLQWEGPHPKNHDFQLPDTKFFIKSIGKKLEGNYYIGLKWVAQTVKPDSSPATGGIRCRMWVDKDAIGPDGKPKNNWELVYDFIDGVDAKVIDPQTYQMPDEMDMEIRKSGTQKHDVFGQGLHVRAL